MLIEERGKGVEKVAEVGGWLHSEGS